MKRAILFVCSVLGAVVGCAPPADDQDQAATEDLSFICQPHEDGPACERERRVAERFAELRANDRDALRKLLVEMPKGGDLHSHLSGAVTTEQLIDWAIEDGLCADADLKAVKCSASATPIDQVPRDKLLAAWSMEGFDGSVQQGHDHFFATFGRFGLVTKTRTGDMLAAVRARAAEHGEQYLELMLALGTSKAGSVGQSLLADLGGWDADRVRAARSELAADAGFRQNVAAAAAELDGQIRQSEELLGCEGFEPAPGCGVEVRYLVQVWRASSRESVLAQAVHAYELAAAEPRVVGFNLAAAEDHPSSLAGYRDVMLALGVLREEYPEGAQVSLHAGELVPGLLPADQHEHLGFHIREAVLTAGAQRIGHGVDVLGESDGDFGADDLLAEMSERGVAVEVCRSSNRLILGVEGHEHPMTAYLAADVPVVIATDDEGVARSSLPEELALAVIDHELEYQTVKQLARDSLVHAFLPGDSLFVQTAMPTLDPSVALDDSERARLQLDLERALATFESQIVTEP